MKTITITGRTTKTGNYGFYNIGELELFAKKNPDKNLIVTIQIENKKSTKGIIAYYYAKIIPIWSEYYHKSGIIKNIIEIDVELRGKCPITNLKSLSELTYNEALLFLDQIKIITIENLNVFIEEPRLL